MQCANLVEDTSGSSFNQILDGVGHGKILSEVPIIVSKLHLPHVGSEGRNFQETTPYSGHRAALIPYLLHRRVKDGGLDRLLGKWFNAGILDGEQLSYTDRGTSQGSVIGPSIANIYLHYVMDEWFIKEVSPRLRGRCFLVRFTDDAVLGFEFEEDARRVREVLFKRLNKYGLEAHAKKTRLVKFTRPPKGSVKDRTNGTCDFLGFTHYWAKSRKGYWVVKRRTIRKRLRRAISRFNDWCQYNRHLSI